jgi:predicted pyridoxine 5'-phosphate oxidase superfamily flavin-nucleotide-binding protein
MPDQHRNLFEKLPLLFVATLDDEGRPWASVLTGPPGFVSSPNAKILRVQARPVQADPLSSNLSPGASMGALGIELHTRRRNRANGIVRSIGSSSFELDVRESFGNCPKYIQARALRGFEPTRSSERTRTEGHRLSSRALEIVRGADTFFIATVAPAGSTGDAFTTLDISHRGGRPGFVRPSEEEEERQTVLTFPDYVGNFLFNTIGNLEIEPRAALLFIDFERGDVLQLTGAAAVVWEGPLVDSVPGAQRLVRFAVTEGVLREEALGLRWSEVEFAPELVGTGP